ncbi:hypothetical protein BJY24_000808 [Nocardia transvalensis]|uniref:Tocopherol cyclase-like protein n=1 Tax=Nocardia transvalensis TaxID=37333 RepID=A0A7W9UGC8_9NOCA|nr:hypothetical protein [Nocardia transvalensis]MBB5911941.1 hypothetical protein [Nocardia transvalensis]
MRLPPTLGPAGPFPRAPLLHELDRRWLHYAFRSPDGAVSVIANLSTLGSSEAKDEQPQDMSILLVHDRRTGWQSSQFNASISGEPWSSFRTPGSPGTLRIAGHDGTPLIDLTLRRTGRPCTSQCAPFRPRQHLRWQSEPGIVATGTVGTDRSPRSRVTLLGYHERVRGRWGWPDLGGWVFGFANVPAESPGPPPYSVVFTLIQPRAPHQAATGSVMLWRDGRLIRHFPRRRLDVAVAGLLSRDTVHLCPPLAATLGTPPAAPVPRRLAITAALGPDRLRIAVEAETAGRICNPSETSLLPFSVHEVLGPCSVTGIVNGTEFAFTAGAIVEFAGGAHDD